MSTLDKKITELTELTVPLANDVFAIVDIANGITKKVKFSNVESDLSGYVPYTGADANLNLGLYNLITTGRIYTPRIESGGGNLAISAAAGVTAVYLVSSQGGTAEIRADLFGTAAISNSLGTQKFSYVNFYDRLEVYVPMLFNDNIKLYFGTGLDTSIYFNAADLIINSENVTALDEVHFTNWTAIDFGTANISGVGTLGATSISATTGIGAPNIYGTTSVISDRFYSYTGSNLLFDWAGGWLNVSQDMNLWTHDILGAGNITIDSDSSSLILGNGQDAKIYFNGADLIINSENVTALDEVHFTNWTAVDFSSANLITTGTVQAEQLTSTDDITMQGHLLSLGDVGAATDTVVSILGSTNSATITYDESEDTVDFANTNIDTAGFIEIATSTDATTGVMTQNGTVLYHNYGTLNFFMGEGAGNFTTTGDGQNMGLGYHALDSLTNGTYNFCAGANAGTAITEGVGNVALGPALVSTTKGSYNTAIGRYSLFSNVLASYNVGVGYGTLFDLSGQYDNYNTAVGVRSLTNADGAQKNTAVGYEAMKTSIGGDYNTAVGNQAGYTNETGARCVYIGNEAGYYETGTAKLFIDNIKRTNEADGRVKAMIYGIFAAATADQYLTINANTIITEDTYWTGAGSGLPYAEIYGHDVDENLVMAAQDTWYQVISFNTNGVNNLTTPDHTNDHITVVKTGVYKLFMNVSAASATAEDWVVSPFKNNGATQLSCADVHFTTIAGAKEVTSSNSCLISLTAGDTIEVWAMRTTSGGASKTLIINSVGINLVMIGG